MSMEAEASHRVRRFLINARARTVGEPELESRNFFVRCGRRARRWLLLHPPELRAALQLEPTAASRETSGTSASAAPSSRPRVRRECAPAHGEMDAKRK